jgi:hypothetical protein
MDAKDSLQGMPMDGINPNRAAFQGWPSFFEKLNSLRWQQSSPARTNFWLLMQIICCEVGRLRNLKMNDEKTNI